MITFDSTEIVNSTYIPQYIKHETVAGRDLSYLSLAREDGAILISEKYGIKHIYLIGKLTATTRAGLDTAIDDFKELFSRPEKNLDIDWGGGTRRYVATCVNHFFDRDYYHKLFVPWAVEFVVMEGIGITPTLTASLDAVSADPTFTGEVNFDGSAKPRPIITLTFGANWTNADGIELENEDTDEKIVITSKLIPSGETFGTATDVLEIDCNAKTVTYEDMEIGFYGVFPTFAVDTIRANSIKIAAGDIVDQQYTPATFGHIRPIYNSDPNNPAVMRMAAQSFTVPHTDDTYQGVSLYLTETGAGVLNDLDIEIQTDSSGKPSGTEVTNATFTITEAAITAGGAGWKTINSTNQFTLEANTRYWIVAFLDTGVSDGSGAHYYGWYGNSDSRANYGRGNGATTVDSGTNWTDVPGTDYAFKLLYGGKVDAPAGTLTLDIDHYRRYL